MSSTLQRVKSLLLPNSVNSLDGETRPEIGFKITHHQDTNELVIKVIGARNLPKIYGNVKPQGYLVKVKVFPGREKYETEVFKDSSPYFNQDFKFPLNKNQNDPFAGKFITLTVYAVLDQQDNKSKIKPRTSFKEHVQAFISSNQNESRIVRRNSSRLAFNNRRTIGTVTYNLDKNVLTQVLKNKTKSSLDIWRDVQSITSGVPVESRESKKGSLEITMTYSSSEDGRNDLIQVSLSKLRCSMQTMQEHEKLGGALYIKMVALEYDVEVGKWKGDSFRPTISMKIEPQSATMQAHINSYNINQVQILIKIKSKTLAKKTLLGEIHIQRSSYIWRQMLESPSVPVTLMMDFV